MSLKGNIEERACALACYIIEHRTTVRAAAKVFGVSKSTVHIEQIKTNGLFGWSNEIAADGWSVCRIFLNQSPADCIARSPLFICHCIYHGNCNRNAEFGLIKIASSGKKCYNSV